MSSRAAELADRRMALRARCAQQRGELAAASQTLERHLGLVDYGVALIRRAASTPVLIAAGVALVIFIRPGRLFRWATNLLFLTAAYKRIARD